MISNERHWPSQHPAPRPPQPYYERPDDLQPPRSPETILTSRELQVERKLFIIQLKENARGRFLRIIEDRPVKSSSVIVPITGLQDFQTLIGSMVKADAEIPHKETPPETPSPASA